MVISLTETIDLISNMGVMIKRFNKQLLNMTDTDMIVI